MRKILLVTLMLLLTASWSFAADFSPILLTLTAPESIQYDFDGSDLSIPFDVAGTSAAVWLVINTKGKADDIISVRNGFLGWHYVNKIDTTVYVSSRYERDPGDATIVWDGNDTDGNLLAADTYSYYLWGYDNKTERQLAAYYIQVGHGWHPQQADIVEVGEDGMLLPSPLIMGAYWFRAFRKAWNYNIDFDYGTHFIWTLGADPLDVKNVKYTVTPGYPLDDPIREDGTTQYGDGGRPTDFVFGGPVFNPTDYTTFYHWSGEWNTHTGTIKKWQWVSDGEAIMDEDWLGWDEVRWDEKGLRGNGDNMNPLHTDRNYIYMLTEGRWQKEEEWGGIRCISFDGEVIYDKTLHDWYMPDDPNPHDFINGAANNASMRFDDQIGICSHISCLFQMLNLAPLREDPDNDADMVMWGNRNGDYYLDTASEPDVEPAWYCIGDSKETAPRRASFGIDENGFSMIHAGWIGISSFCIFTQDGTGIDYMAYADDSSAENLYEKFGGIFCDGGTNFDGIYTDNRVNENELWDSEQPVAKAAKIGDSRDQHASTWFVASDSVGGIITNEVVTPAVEEATLAAFAVDQNSPNPFNPTTSISFTIPSADHVAVDIYNVAGQKIDTLVNDFMDAGNHSITWDASELSNGVYFYTVKSGNFSKTMKMTLLK